MINYILLLDENGNEFPLKLNTVKAPYVIEDILNINYKVKDDIYYSISIDKCEDVSNISVYVNGEFVETDYINGKVRFTGDNRYLFSGIIGLAQLSFNVIYDNQNEEHYFSEYVSVLIKQSNTNKSIESMFKYVYENQGDIFRQETKVTNIGDKSSDQFNDFWSHIILLEEIANVYEESYGYFKANCRYKLESVDVLDRVEKLQYVDSKTIQYITQHPEYLKREIIGIKYGRQTFLPSKTLMRQNKITNDIYENQVVYSFLETILEDVEVLQNKIKDYIRLIRYDDATENGYIVSSYLIYVNAREVLVEFLNRVNQLKNQLSKMVTMYSSIFNVDKKILFYLPKSTAIFINVPQYNRIYMNIIRWYSRKGYDFSNERVMLNFFDAPSIYEAYVLIKLINQIKDMGFEIKETKNMIYPKNTNWTYNSSGWNNTFIFEDDNSELTLYYEPFIYDEDRRYVNKIALYRNNSISLSRETDEERHGKYYVPDYIIKYKEGNKENYIICDAKFSRRNKILYKLMPDLIYKYISSISTIGYNISIKGLCIFYGADQDSTIAESFYNNQLSDDKPIQPFIELIPLSENISYSDQVKNSIRIFKNVINDK